MAATDLSPPAGAAPEGRIAVVAGGGALPVAVVRTLLTKGEAPLVAVVAGEATAADFAGAERFDVAVEDLGPLLARLRKEGIGRVILALPEVSATGREAERLSLSPWAATLPIV